MKTDERVVEHFYLLQIPENQVPHFLMKWGHSLFLSLHFIAGITHRSFTSSVDAHGQV